VDKVTLRINKKSQDRDQLTLRQAIMNLPADVPLVIIVNDGGKTADGREVRNHWSVTLGSYREDSVGYRKDRVAALSTFTLCDMGVLLDERTARIGLIHSYPSSSFSITVEANPDEEGK
jgi:hypothetical protein